MAKTTTIKVPDIGGSSKVPVIELLVKNGERIEKDQALLVLESDKATMEVPSPAAGIVSGLNLKIGDKVSEGDVICTVEMADAAAASPPSAPAGGGREGGATPAKKSSSAQSPLPLETSSSQSREGQTAMQGSLPSPSLVPVRGEGGDRTEVRVPDIGSFSGIPVIEVLVKDGDRVAKDAPLMVLESDKATMEVPAPAAGIVRSFKLKVGDKVSQSDVVCVIEGSSSAPPTSAPAPKAVTATPPPAATSKPVAPTATPAPAVPSSVAPASNELAYAGPATRKFARELGVDLSRVKASGPRGRILIEDVQAHVKAALKSPASSLQSSGTSGSGIPPIPAQDFSQFGSIETKPLARIRKLSAAHLSRAWLNIPHVTQFDEADITELEIFRKSSSEEGGVKLTLLPFLMKAVSVALRSFPEFNSSLAPDGENLILKNYCHLGFAADTPNGLVVPVVREVWSKGLMQLATECSALAAKAREGKLKPDEMRGGCFSISSLGGLGVTGGFTPIVNAPEVAILGVSRASMKPVWDGKTFQPRLMLPLSLSYDHRVIDGAYAARFMVQLTKSFADLRRLML